jgi:glycosyltransferase involved in cell wall biosynthesis
MPGLTIGMPTHNDYEGVYFTLQSLRLYHDLEDTELLVVDTYGCTLTRDLVQALGGARYILAPGATGTAQAKEIVFREARGDAVLCCDCHVLIVPGAIARLRQFYRDNPDCDDLLQGPLLYDDGRSISTHFDPVWRGQMWGTWGTDPRGTDAGGAPFEIPMQGLGVFSCRRRAWVGFNSGLRGFGGEEGYIHEKFRQTGRRCLCLPWLRWMHRFNRPGGPRFAVTVQDKVRNYAIGYAELGLDPEPVVSHFSTVLPRREVIAIVEQALEVEWIAA